MTRARLELHSLTVVPERGDFIVGRPGTDSYVLLPADGVALLRQLQNGAPPAEAATWYQATYGEAVDIEDFVSALRELGFVRAPGDFGVASPVSVRYRTLGRLVFSPLAWIFYLALILACVLAMMRHSELGPQAQQVFFTDSLVVVQVVLLLGQLPCILWHESFHVLAGRRLGLPSRLGMSKRLYFIVFETTLNGLLGVPRKQRYLPFLAGMLADVLLFSALTLGAAADLAGGITWGGRLALALAYATLLRLLWQFYLFLRTDLYYVFATALGCINLHEAARARLTNWLRRLPGFRRPPMDGSAWSPRDWAVARWYAPLMGVGVAFLLGVAVMTVVPITAGFIVRLTQSLRDGSVADAQFWDSTVSVCLIFAQFALVLVMVVRNRRRVRAATSSRLL
jgi:hypothetical protein